MLYSIYIIAFWITSSDFFIESEFFTVILVNFSLFLFSLVCISFQYYVHQVIPFISQSPYDYVKVITEGEKTLNFISLLNVENCYKTMWLRNKSLFVWKKSCFHPLILWLNDFWRWRIFSAYWRIILYYFKNRIGVKTFHKIIKYHIKYLHIYKYMQCYLNFLY